MALDVFQYAVVGRRLAALVVLVLESVDRDGYQQAGQTDIHARDRPHGDGHELRMYVSCSELRQNLIQLTIAHQRLAADDRDVQRPMMIDERHESRHQFVAFVIGETAQRDVAAEVLVAIGVAARTAQRTFLGDLDRQVRTIAREDPAPGLDQLASANGVSAHVTTIMCESRGTRAPNSRITCYPVC